MTVRPILMLTALLLASPARAEERFFKVYEWETPPRAWLEPNLWTTYLAKRDATTPRFGESVDENRAWAHQLEAEYGVTDELAAAIYGTFDDPQGEPARYRETRLEVRYRLFNRYERIVETALYAEYRIPRVGFGEPESLELKLILQRDFGDVRVILNPALSRALAGASMLAASEAALASGLYYRRLHALQPGLELYDEFGSVQQPRIQDERHHLFATVDLRYGNAWDWHLGAGYGLTEEHEVTLKSILRYEFETVRPSQQAR